MILSDLFLTAVLLTAVILFGLKIWAAWFKSPRVNNAAAHPYQPIDGHQWLWCLLLTVPILLLFIAWFNIG